MKRGVVISAGTINDYDYIKSFINKEDYVICADGGAEHAKRMNITPSLTVGDFDSCKCAPSGEVRRFNPEKDYTDTHIAVSAALEKGCDEIILLGCIGTRMDHTLANIGILEHILNNGKKGVMVNEHNEIRVIEGNSEIKKDEFKYVSLIPIGKAKGVTIENMKYTLSDYDMSFDCSIGVSNEVINGDGIVKIKEGRLILIKSRD